MYNYGLIFKILHLKKKFEPPCILFKNALLNEIFLTILSKNILLTYKITYSNETNTKSTEGSYTNSIWIGFKENVRPFST
jgi:hypothetical protein